MPIELAEIENRGHLRTSDFCTGPAYSRREFLALLGSALLLPPVLQVSKCLAEDRVSGASSRGTKFLHREKNTLFLGSIPFRCYGVNKHELWEQYLRQDWTIGKEARDQAILAMKEAQRCNLQVWRVRATGYYPAWMQLWRSDPDTYWKLFDLMLDQCDTYGISIIPSIAWNLFLFADLANERLQDLFGNPQSQSRQLLYLYTRQIAERYGERQTILFWELTCEMNLAADMAFTNIYPKLSSLSEMRWGCPIIRTSRDHFTSDQLFDFIRDWAEQLKQWDPNHLIGTGFAMPRRSAAHLRRRQGWTQDSPEEFASYLADAHPDPVDLVSVHYGVETNAHGEAEDTQRFGITDKYSAESLRTAKAAADAINKPLYLGEAGAGTDYAGDLRFNRNVVNMCGELDIPLTLWWTWMEFGDSSHPPVLTPDHKAMLRLLQTGGANND